MPNASALSEKKLPLVVVGSLEQDLRQHFYNNFTASEKHIFYEPDTYLGKDK